MKCSGEFLRMPLDQGFYLQSEENLVSEIRRLGLELPIEAGGRSVLQPLEVAGRRVVANRFCACPEDGNDAGPEGAPSPTTHRRYERLAIGGSGLICTEPFAVAPSFRRHPRQLCLHAGTVSAFAAMLAQIRARVAEGSREPPLLLLQLDEVGAGSELPAGSSYADAARRAGEAGFDGIELRCNAERLAADLTAGGAWRQSAAIEAIPLHVCDAAACVRAACPDLLLAVRLCVYTAHRCSPPGFGTDAEDYRHPDPARPIHLARRLASLGVGLLNTTANHPRLRDALAAEAYRPVAPEGFPQEHPLGALARGMQVARALREAVPGLAVSAGGLVWLRQYLPAVAGGLIREGAVDLVSTSRFSLAYPDAPLDWARQGVLDPGRCCIQCGACSWLREAGSPVGCVLQERDLHGPEFRFRNRYDPERLLAEARRCHQCSPPPCVAAMPSRLDIPKFMRAYARGDVRRAGRMLRDAQFLPEMCAQLSPFSASGENDCIETVLFGRPVAIRDLQYSAAAETRECEGAAVPLPDATGFRVVIVGAGPAGLAAAAALLQHGHQVTLYEQSATSGGVPALLIPATRHGGEREEIERLLGPARLAGRLEEHYRTRVETDVFIHDLRAESDAVLLASGLWKDRLLFGDGGGVYGGLAFLEQAKAGRLIGFSGAMAVLAGGDCAMDSASVLKAMGADPLYILFGGGRSELHWCMEESWFAQPGVHLLTLCKPIGYRRDERGRVTGVRTQRMAPAGAAGEAARPVPDGVCTIAVDAVVDASSLEAEERIRAALDGGGEGLFAAGALVNGGASVPQCVAEGMRAGESLHRWLLERKVQPKAGGLEPCS